MIYLDSSVALAHLLAEDRFPFNELWEEQLASSRLLECEVWNRINAHQLQNSHGEAVRNLIGRIAMVEMIGPVLTRAPLSGHNASKPSAPQIYRFIA
jgi:hypothetical protein